MEKIFPYPHNQRYSEALKRQVVQEYERGNVTKDDLMRKYKIGGHSMVLQWCRKYGKLYYTKRRNPIGITIIEYVQPIFSSEVRIFDHRNLEIRNFYSMFSCSKYKPITLQSI